MIDRSNNTQRNAFARWLRTGQPPTLSNSDGLELKFNPWHDPADGRFTSVGAGHRYGARGELLKAVGGVTLTEKRRCELATLAESARLAFARPLPTKANGH